jgi:predicted ArsR family transcriptional regulator
MNRSRYVTRQLDKIDREIIAALTEDGRMTLKELAEQIGMASPSVRARLLKLEDAGAILVFRNLPRDIIQPLTEQADIPLPPQQLPFN